MPKLKEIPIDIKKSAEFTGYSKSYLRALSRDRIIPSYKPSGKRGKIFFLKSDLVKFMRGKRTASNDELNAQADAIMARRGERA